LNFIADDAAVGNDVLPAELEDELVDAMIIDIDAKIATSKEMQLYKKNLIEAIEVAKINERVVNVMRNGKDAIKAAN
jgi:hypothetical protein